MSRLPLGRAATTVVVIGAILFVLADVGQQEGGLWPDGPEWIGAVGWFGFLLCLLLLALIAVAAVARRLAVRGPASR